ncbi:MAG: ABC transporter ATP-binding protein [Anaerolineae bacterium]|jgi:ABC-type multidrug transport system fused ATPase/permease subunit|nr:ABC transporter ATP-binding protein [Anaerolineae bacterium]
MQYSYEVPQGKSQRIPLRVYVGIFGKYLASRWQLVLLVGVIILANTALRLINPQLISDFIDGAMSGVPRTDLTRLAVIFLIFSVLEQALMILGAYLIQLVTWGATNDLRNDVMEHTLRLDLSFHNNHSPGEMIERLVGDIQQLGDFFSRMTITLVANLLIIVSVVGLLWHENWTLGAVLAAFISVILVILYLTRNIAVQSFRDVRKAYADLFGFIEERLAGMEDIVGNGGRDYTIFRMAEKYRTVRKTEIRQSLMGNLFYVTGFMPFMVGITVVLGMSANLYLRGLITLGTVYLTYHYTTMMRQPLQSIAFQLRNFQNATAGIWRIQELMSQTTSSPEKAHPIALNIPEEKQPLGVSYTDVSFRYDDQPPSELVALAKRANQQNHPDELILKNISFDLEPGKILGLLGRTGSGKTTLIRLLCRLYDPVSGAIRIGYPGQNMVDLRDMTYQDLRRDVGVITQQVQLFYASIRDNLTFFDASVSDERILEVIHQLGVENWFKALPQGLDTRIETGAVGLSAGESQLLAFTRIFLRDPGLVILDEASSRIDPATEAMLERAMDRLIANRTAIIIAHRLATVQRADEIMILSGGEIEEYGLRTDLIADSDSLFSQLMRTGIEEVLK